MTRLLFPDFKRMFGSLLGDTSAATALARRQGEQLRNKANQRHRAALGTKGTASLNSTFTEVKTEARPTQPAARPQPPCHRRLAFPSAPATAAARHVDETGRGVCFVECLRYPQDAPPAYAG
ncbi:hypothetical protein AGDE_14372 [Angomonas deanei]|uniref:Uncharacterized protein n=1 Tax=Angomonas deanei TaxID=59799 RepID=A0A7G2CIX5_9TRYP|nr:hypothetical protein AGDE_14372 [Angomonas deanei]CAD2219800.1 hypothetical protein, conserved [Angomonas deanei]|eukprot:EPY20958.1 hypothetical protein AGDE_14372 [Angomonas deanei]